MLAVLGVICFVICRGRHLPGSLHNRDNKNALDHNLGMKTEWRITFQRGDFIGFDSKNDIVVGSIENIRDKISAQDNGSPVIYCWSTDTGGQLEDIWDFGNNGHGQCKGWRQFSVDFL